ncbi:MAG TPA: hypothetical protein VN622_05740, partial [Clostridia bacterium]|nr:hypothetical protein [Clostridia bacterium]
MESPNTVTPEQSVVPFAPHALEETRRTLTPHEAAAPKELTLRDYWHVLLRRKGAIGAFLLVVMMVVTLITLRTPSRYVSTGRISVSRENPDVAGFKNGVSS